LNSFSRAASDVVLPERVRQLQVVEGRNPRLELAEDAGEVAALREDVHAEARLAGQPVRAVARALLHQELAESAVAVDEVQREDLGLERRQRLDRRADGHADELTRRLDLQRAVDRDVEVGDVLVRLEHGRQHVVDLGLAHGLPFPP
jgi:hypothetical protein